jgi:hypothetical protein
VIANRRSNYAPIRGASKAHHQGKHIWVTGSAHAPQLTLLCLQETERLVADSPPGISAIPHDDNLRYFDVIIDGPSDSAFEGGKFKLELFLPEEYPMGAPKVRYVQLFGVGYADPEYCPNVRDLWICRPSVIKAS